MFFLLVFACHFEDNRKSWIHKVLVDDNIIWLDRPELVAHKFEVMSSHPYDFMRGTLSLHIQEAQRISGTRTKFNYYDTDSVLFFQIGDPHPENLNISVQVSDPSQYQVFWSDMDATGFGPWYWDLRRAGVGLWFFADAIECDCTQQLLTALIEGYISQGIQDTALA